jgi:hypothetical protein
MTLPETLLAVWQQVLAEGRDRVTLGEESYPVKSTRSKKLRLVEFTWGEHELVGIEQNPKTASRWAELARRGKLIMQFSCQGRYIANVCQGKLLRYPAWQGLRLPD